MNHALLLARLPLYFGKRCAMAIDRIGFARECVLQGEHFGVHSHYMLAVAQLRSGIADDDLSDLIGPFRLSQQQWNNYLTTERADIRPEDISNGAGAGFIRVPGAPPPRSGYSHSRAERPSIGCHPLRIPWFD